MFCLPIYLTISFNDTFDFDKLYLPPPPIVNLYGIFCIFVVTEHL